MKHRAVTTASFAALIAGLFMGGQVLAFDQGNWLLRGGLAYISPNDDSDAITGVPGSEIGVDDAATFGFTVGYMFTNNVSVELLGIWPANHDLEGEGTLPGLGINDVGELDIWTPTVSVNYYFMQGSKFRPHIGAGLTYTTYMDEEVSGQARATASWPN